jgi:hypothetical protein
MEEEGALNAFELSDTAIALVNRRGEVYRLNGAAETRSRCCRIPPKLFELDRRRPSGGSRVFQDGGT